MGRTGKFNCKTGLADQPLMGKLDTIDANQFSKISFASGCLMLIPSHILKSVGLLDQSFLCMQKILIIVVE